MKWAIYKVIRVSKHLNKVIIGGHGAAAPICESRSYVDEDVE